MLVGVLNVADSIFEVVELLIWMSHARCRQRIIELANILGKHVKRQRYQYVDFKNGISTLLVPGAIIIFALWVQIELFALSKCPVEAAFNP